MNQPTSPNNSPREKAIRSLEVDMSPDAIERRLRDIGQLHKTWQSLRQFKEVIPPHLPENKTTDSFDQR